MQIFLISTAALLIGVFIGFFLKGSGNRKKELLTFEEEKKTLADYQKKIKNAEEEYANVQDRIRETSDNFEKTLSVLKDSQERELKAYHKCRIEEINQKIIQADAELNNHYQKNRLKYIEEINKIKDELSDFKSARQAIIQEQRRQEEIEKEKYFYTVQLNEMDKEDILQLKTIENKLNNKEVLNKLIFETFYKKPMTDMFGRVVGNKKPCGIYKITNMKDGKSYIGKSVEIVPKRWTEHIKTSLNIGSISRTKIHDAMKEKGIENFTFEILEECPKEKLGEREKFWISFYETNTYGYNIKGGG